MKADSFSQKLFVVFLCLASLLGIVLWPSDGCISLEHSTKLFREAKMLEQHYKLQDAYQRYSVVSEQGCKSLERGEAGASATRLAKNIRIAHDETVAALEAYRMHNGKYPDSLAEVVKNIPDDSLAAFNGFGYNKESDVKMGIVTGLYGSATFSLKQ